MIVTRSHSASTSARMWLESSTVRPARALVARRTRGTPPPSAGPGPDVGSSRISSSTSEASAATSATFWRLPLEYARPFLVGSSSKRSSSSRAALLVEAAAQAAEQVDRLAAGEVRPQRHVAGHVGEPAVQGDRVAPRVAAEQPRRRRRRRAAARAAPGSSSTCPRRWGRGSRGPRPRRPRGRARRARASRRSVLTRPETEIADMIHKIHEILKVLKLVKFAAVTDDAASRFVERFASVLVDERRCRACPRACSRSCSPPTRAG